MYRYIALLDRHRPDHRGELAQLDAGFRAMGLRPVPCGPGIALYVAADTPVVPLPAGGALLGDVFARHADGPVDRAAWAQAASAPALVQHLLEACWGEYLLLAPGREAGAVTVMRDPSGGVGCVYALREGFLTSDITLATRAGLYARQVDWEFIQGTLRYPHHKAGRTGLAGLRELLPGCRLDLDRNGAHVEAVWSPWAFVAPACRHRDRATAQAEVRHAVASSVRQWADTDAAVLLELSGGLDSSVVAACLAGTSARVACCNLVTPVPGADERSYARRMAEALQVELQVRTLGFEQTPVDCPPPAHAVMPGTGFLQHASNALKEAIGQQLGIDRFFSGGGGDTVFGHTRSAAPAADAFRECGAGAGLAAVRDLAELHQCTVWKAGRLALSKLRGPPKPPRRPDPSFLSAADGPAELEPHPWFAAPADALPGDRERIFDLAGTQVFRDALARSARGRLRMPLLSQPVVEACLRVPSWMWIAGGRNRAVARDAFADVLPGPILHRRSKGTFLNYTGAVYRRHRAGIRDHLLGGRLAGHGLLDLPALGRVFDRELAPRDEAYLRLFDLCAIENWLRHQA